MPNFRTTNDVPKVRIGGGGVTSSSSTSNVFDTAVFDAATFDVTVPLYGGSGESSHARITNIIPNVRIRLGDS